MSVYFSRGTVIDTIAKTAMPRDSLEKSLVKERLTFIKNNVDRIEKLLGAPYSKIDIADMYWGRGKMREGHNFETSDKTYFILVDKAFWNLASLTHEILHCYTDYDSTVCAMRSATSCHFGAASVSGAARRSSVMQRNKILFNVPPSS